MALLNAVRRIHGALLLTRCCLLPGFLFLVPLGFISSANSQPADSTNKILFPNREPYPQAKSKKGLQVQMVDDALSLGIKHAALNCDLGRILSPSGNTNDPGWRHEDQIFYVNEGYLAHLDQQVKPLSEKGVIVSLILLVYERGDKKVDDLMLHPAYEKACPNKLSAFNTKTESGKAAYEFCLRTLAERYSRPDQKYGRIWNYIVGNEVNSHWFWYNRGLASMEEVAEDYFQAVSICHQTVHRVLPSARVFLSLEHHWSIKYPGGNARQAFPGRPFLELFNRIAKAHGDFPWHLAYHPYPENLFDPKVWKDRSAEFHENTPRITFKNLEILPAYLNRPEFLFQGSPRRILLSEQGFHTPAGVDGEMLQAAGFCYGYVKANFLPTVDAFILHRHVDHAREGGLNLGLWTRDETSGSHSEPGRRKLIYPVFKAADTESWEKEFAFALPIVGLSSWEALRPK